MFKYVKRRQGMVYPNLLERVLLNSLSVQRFCGYVEHYMLHNYYGHLEYDCKPNGHKGKDGVALCSGKLLPMNFENEK